MKTNDTYDIAKGNFWFLMDCIEGAEEKLAAPRKGQLYFISDSEVADLVVSKYRKGGMSYFKAFFCNVVLELHEDGAELNFKEYEEYFGSQKGKKYAICADRMNRCLEGDKQSDYFVPVRLLARLKEVAHECLKEYFLINEEENARIHEVENNRKYKLYTKEERYLRFVTAVCLYEIFVQKFLGKDIFQQAMHAIEEFRTNADQLTSLAEELKAVSASHQSEPGVGTAKEQEGELSKKIDEIRKKLETVQEQQQVLKKKCPATIEKATLYILHIRYIEAFCTMISMVEFVNVNTTHIVPKRMKNNVMLETLQKQVKKESDYLFMRDIRLDKNNVDIYKMFLESVETERMLQELCSQSEEVQREALEELRQYYKMVRDGVEADDEDFVKVVCKIFQKKCR